MTFAALVEGISLPVERGMSAAGQLTSEKQMKGLNVCINMTASASLFDCQNIFGHERCRFLSNLQRLNIQCTALDIPVSYGATPASQLCQHVEEM